MTNQAEQNTAGPIENKYFYDLRIALERLEQTPEFKAVITEGYFKDKALNHVSLLANPQTIRMGKRAELMEMLIAISHLEDYFLMIKNLGADPSELDEDDEAEYKASNSNVL